MKKIINDFINSIDTKLYSRIRASKGDAECRRYLKEHLQKQLSIHGVSNSCGVDDISILIKGLEDISKWDDEQEEWYDDPGHCANMTLIKYYNSKK